jgi:hypothetical protein
MEGSGGVGADAMFPHKETETFMALNYSKNGSFEIRKGKSTLERR